MNVSKNQVVWARCHLVGLTSGIDCTTQSSGARFSANLAVKFRTSRKRARSFSAGDDSACERFCAVAVRFAVATAVWIKLFHPPGRVLLCAPRASDHELLLLFRH